MSKLTKTKKLSSELLIQIHDRMVCTRELEERLVKMYKTNDGYFWIGGPGEEAFNIPLGMLIKKGSGPKYDYFHGHYRSSGVLMAMGADPQGSIRQMKNTANDPYSGGRNFCNHQSIQKWNVCPISSPIEVQYAMAPGTAIANKREKSDGITIVVGGDAGTAEGEFASCLIWSSRPANPLPMLILVTNNNWGISTKADGQHGEKNIADRARAFGMPAEVIDGQNPEESYLKIKAAMEYVRKERKPYFIEAKVSRLYGHSSASGANFVQNETDCLKDFEKRLEKEGILTRKKMDAIRSKYSEMMLKYSQEAREEPQPDPESIWNNVYRNLDGSRQIGKTERFW